MRSSQISSYLRKASARRSAFSLLELLAVVTIIGIIAVVVVPRISTSSDMAKQSADAKNRSMINSAIERYYVNTGSWPSANLNELDSPNTYDYFPDGLPVSPIDGQPYLMDLTTHRVG